MTDTVNGEVVGEYSIEYGESALTVVLTNLPGKTGHDSSMEDFLEGGEYKLVKVDGRGGVPDFEGQKVFKGK